VIDKSLVKEVPATWGIEIHPAGNCQVIVLERPRESGGGMVSIDFRLRVFDAGHQLPRAFPPNYSCPDRFTGHEWRKRLVREAVSWLISAMESK